MTFLLMGQGIPSEPELQPLGETPVETARRTLSPRVPVLPHPEPVRLTDQSQERLGMKRRAMHEVWIEAANLRLPALFCDCFVSHSSKWKVLTKPILLALYATVMNLTEIWPSDFLSYKAEVQSF